MNLKCYKCGNTQEFMAESQATIDVIIDGSGKILDARPHDQLLKHIIVIKPTKCLACGADINS